MDNNDIIVSVKCAVYNHEFYLRQCLEGFIMQKTNFRFEVIVHDDASTDGSVAIIREYAEKYPDIIKPIYETENQYSKHDGSVVKIMNAACKGKYIAMCEGDDYWIDPLKLQKQVDFLEQNPDYGLVYTNVDFFYQNKNRYEHEKLTDGTLKRSFDFESHLLNKGYIAPCTWVLRKEFILNDNTKSYVDGTFPLALDIFAVSKVYFLNDSTAVYRVLSESASHSKSLLKQYIFEIGVFQIQKDYIAKYKVSDNVVEKIYSNAYKKLLTKSIALKKDDFVIEAVNYLRNNNEIIGFKVKSLVFLYNLSPRFIRYILNVKFKCDGFKFK